MKNKRKLKFGLLGLKALGYRIIRFITNLTMFGIILGEWNKAFKFSILLVLISTITYFIYDSVFNFLFNVEVKTKSKIVYFSGLSGSGKSTIATELAKKLLKKGERIQILDGDVLRSGICNDLGFSIEDRKTNLRRAIEIAKILTDNSIVVLCSFISPLRKLRNQFKRECNNFIEVYVKCSLDECEKRDVKGLYAKARKGIIKQFTGIDSPYEAPLKPNITCDTEKETVEESTNKILNYLKREK